MIRGDMNTILLTNDDGYGSVALHDFYHYVSNQFRDAETVLISPHENKSGISHAITLISPLVFREKEALHFDVKGYPADCVMIGDLMLENIDIIISGPNFGSNLGHDIIYSGTVAAAREGAMRGIPALAFSFVDEAHNLVHVNYDDWHAFLDKWFHALVKLALHNKGDIVNVNVSIPIGLDLEEGTLGSRYYYSYQRIEKDRDQQGEYYKAILKNGVDESIEVEPGSDVALVQQGKNVFSVFSALPKLEIHKGSELLSYMRD